jgi:hypothetical protein
MPASGPACSVYSYLICKIRACLTRVSERQSGFGQAVYCREKRVRTKRGAKAGGESCGGRRDCVEGRGLVRGGRRSGARREKERCVGVVKKWCVGGSNSSQNANFSRQKRENGGIQNSVGVGGQEVGKLRGSRRGYQKGAKFAFCELLPARESNHRKVREGWSERYNPGFWISPVCNKSLTMRWILVDDRSSRRCSSRCRSVPRKSMYCFLTRNSASCRESGP